jgi:dTDP-glucose 4,6-dehydratase
VSATFLVLGSNSFSGASFVAHLLEREHRVLGVSRSAEPIAAFLPYKWRAQQGFHFHQLDLNRDLDEITSLIGSERPDYVVNFAAQSMVAESWQHPEHWFETNVVATVKLHDRLRHCSFLKKYVHVSTPEVYGSCEGFVREDGPLNPSTPYAVSRAAADMSLRTFLNAYGFPVVWTRAANVFGAGQQLYRIVPRTVLFIKLGRKLQLHGGGVSRRSFVHGRDVAEATLRIACAAPAGETYHIATRRVVSIRELVQSICDRMGVSFADHVEVSEERLGKDAAYLLDSTKIRETLGWRESISLEQGLDEVVAWVNRYFSELRTQSLEYVHKP